MRSGEQIVYIFLDEGGNFDFSRNGTKYFTLTSVTSRRPFGFDRPLADLKYDLIELGLDLEYFHASEDRQAVRDRVFEIIHDYLGEVRIDSLIVEKRKTQPSLRRLASFYPRMLGHLLQSALAALDLSTAVQIVVVTDRIPVAKKHSAVEKAIKTTLATLLPTDMPYRVLHHESKSSFELQAADYCNWAVYRKWDRGDERSYRIIRGAIGSETDILGEGDAFYY